MEVILEKTVPKLGLVGAIVNVSDGYARNFLFPQKLAVQASKHNIAAVEKRIKTIREKELKEQEEAKLLAAKLEGLSINIEVKASEDGKLFGSVTAREIAEAMKTKGYDLDKKVVGLDEPVKFLGVYTVPLKLHALVQTDIKVWVIRESDAENT